MELLIDNEFKNLIPPLTTEEFKQLEINCIKDGIRDAIATWNGYIIDGHNRYEIANKNGLKYVTNELVFENRTDVIEWIILNQFGRRNINNYQRSVLALRLEDVFKAKAKENLKIYGGNQYENAPCQKSDNIQNDDTIFGVNPATKETKKTVTIDTKKELSKIANVSHDTIARVKKIELIASPETKEKLAKGETSINEAYKEIKMQEKKEILENKKLDYEIKISTQQEKDYKIDIYKTDKKFRVVYADPAWNYNDKQNIANLGGAEKHYDTMPINNICDLPIKDITENDAVLFLWVTSPLLEECFEVINKWGFKYKTSFIWDKVKHNMGHYNSVRHELLLIATKGSCTPDNKILFDSVQSIERNDNHSEKPIEFKNIIDTLYNFGDRIELFSRKANKENWYYWGNEV